MLEGTSHTSIGMVREFQLERKTIKPLKFRATFMVLEEKKRERIARA